MVWYMGNGDQDGSSFFQAGARVVVVVSLATFPVTSLNSCTDVGVSRSRVGRKKCRKRHDYFF